MCHRVGLVGTRGLVLDPSRGLDGRGSWGIGDLLLFHFECSMIPMLLVLIGQGKVEMVGKEVHYWLMWRWQIQGQNVVDLHLGDLTVVSLDWWNGELLLRLKLK